MTTTHHPNIRLHPVAPRPRRCLRHRVWMAVCEDCRAAHHERLANERTAAVTPR